MPKPPTDVSGGKPWIDSNLKGNIKPGMETSPKDDFYLYVNYEWLLSTDIPEGARVVGSGLASEGNEHAAKAVSGANLTGPFPLKALAEAQGYGAAGEYLIDDEAEVRAACALFTQENLDLVRDYILVGYALEASGWLDGQAFEAWR